MTELENSEVSDDEEPAETPETTAEPDPELETSRKPQGKVRLQAIFPDGSILGGTSPNVEIPIPEAVEALAKYLAAANFEITVKPAPSGLG